MKTPLLLVTLLLFPMTAAAEVKEAAPDHITLAFSATVKAEPMVAYRALAQVGQWWDGEHSYSGDAKHMTLELAAGGCFCERWSGGSVEHGRVVLAYAGQVLRLDAPLGPLQELGAKATMTYKFEAAAGGGTTVTVGYTVIGVPSQKLDALAPAIDRVLGESVARLASFVNTAAPK
jgi:hypothetical protein